MIEPSELWILIGISVPIVIGFSIMIYFLWQGKGLFLVSGYNMMSQQKKDRYDPLKLGRMVAKILIVTLVFLVLILVAAFANQEGLVIGLTIAMIVFSIVILIYANTGDRLKKDDWL